MGSERVELARRFFASFNDGDLGEFASTLHPEVRIETARGVREGVERACAWATRVPTGELDQVLVVEELREVGERVLALYRRQWRWRGEDEPACEDELAATFEFRDGLISRWRPYAERDEAVAALGQRANAP